MPHAVLLDLLRDAGLVCRAVVEHHEGDRREPHHLRRGAAGPRSGCTDCADAVRTARAARAARRARARRRLAVQVRGRRRGGGRQLTCTSSRDAARAKALRCGDMFARKPCTTSRVLRARRSPSIGLPPVRGTRASAVQSCPPPCERLLTGGGCVHRTWPRGRRRRRRNRRRWGGERGARRGGGLCILRAAGPSPGPQHARVTEHVAPAAGGEAVGAEVGEQKAPQHAAHVPQLRSARQSQLAGLERRVVDVQVDRRHEQAERLDAEHDVVGARVLPRHPPRAGAVRVQQLSLVALPLPQAAVLGLQHAERLLALPAAAPALRGVLEPRQQAVHADAREEQRHPGLVVVPAG